LVEAKANGQMLISDLSKAGIVATPFNPDRYGDKIARVRLITDLIENGRVWLPAAGPTFESLRKWAEEFHSQCVQFPASDSRDWVDTMTMAFLRIKASGWVANTEDPMEEKYDTPLERAAFY
jgi:predicted phage terminase large subunit-like protein